jgi:hypothetical protein
MTLGGFTAQNFTVNYTKAYTTALARTLKVQPSQVALEVTELTPTRQERARQVLRRLQSVGVTIAYTITGLSPAEAAEVKAQHVTMLADVSRFEDELQSEIVRAGALVPQAFGVMSIRQAVVVGAATPPTPGPIAKDEFVGSVSFWLAVVGGAVVLGLGIILTACIVYRRRTEDEEEDGAKGKAHTEMQLHSAAESCGSSLEGAAGSVVTEGETRAARAAMAPIRAGKLSKQFGSNGSPKRPPGSPPMEEEGQSAQRLTGVSRSQQRAERIAELGNKLQNLTRMGYKEDVREEPKQPTESAEQRRRDLERRMQLLVSGGGGSRGGSEASVTPLASEDLDRERDALATQFAALEDRMVQLENGRRQDRTNYPIQHAELAGRMQALASQHERLKSARRQVRIKELERKKNAMEERVPTRGSGRQQAGQHAGQQMMQQAGQKAGQQMMQQGRLIRAAPTPPGPPIGSRTGNMPMHVLGLPLGVGGMGNASLNASSSGTRPRAQLRNQPVHRRGETFDI